MVYCSVLGCQNNSRTKSNSEHIKFHRFPKDKELCRAWISACKRENINVKFARICSVHFRKDSYSLKDRLLNIPIKKKHLHLKAVPTKFLPSDDINERNSKAGKRTRRKPVKNVALQNNLQNFEFLEVLTEPEISERSQATHIDAAIQTEGKINVILLERYKLQRQLKEAKKKIFEQMHMISMLKEQNEKFEKSLSHIFTPGQLEKLKHGTVKKWTSEDISSALRLYFAGPKAYRYMREKNYPLPSLSILQKWTAKINLQPGQSGKIWNSLHISLNIEDVDVDVDFEAINNIIDSIELDEYADTEESSLKDNENTEFNDLLDM